MLGRQRRSRALAAVVCIAIVFFIYQRNSLVANQFAEYVRDKAVGGGAVLRGTEKSPQGQGIVDVTSRVVLQPTNVHELPGNDIPIFTTSGKSGVTAVPNSHPLDSVAQNKPQLPVEVGEGRNVISIDKSATKSPIHWTRPVERFPLSTTIQLPTGSPKPIPLIQYAGKGKADKERLAAVKEATHHAWKGYTTYALGYDEIKPVSGEAKNSFNGWGATLVDSLDTLWIMGMTKEFEEALEQVRRIDFTTSSRADIPLFEVTIRYLGGLLAAYDVSGAKYRILLDKAVELAEILYGAFDTPNRMPITYYQWKPGYSSQPHRAGNRVVLAELGTLNMEFTRLAQITGEPKYYDAIARVTDAFEEWQNHTRVPGMWPVWVDASGCQSPVQKSSYKNSFQKQLPQGSNQQKTQSGPPAFYNGKDTANAHQIEDDSPALKQLHEMADKSSFADDVRDSSWIGPSNGKRQLFPDTKAPAHLTNFNFDSAHDEPSTTVEEDISTGEKICLHAGLNSTSATGSETFTLGGMSDSVYEYLPKEYLLLGGRLDQYKTMYLASASAVIDKLLFRPMTPERRDILFTGDLTVSVNFTTYDLVETRKYRSEHLSCFVGGMFAMGGKIFEDPRHVEIGRRLTDGCIWAYNSTATGIMPETFILSACPSLEQCAWNQTQYNEELDPFTETRQTNPDNFRSKVYNTDLSSSSKSKVLANNPSTSSQLASKNTKTGPKPKQMPEVPGMVDTYGGTVRKRQLGEASHDIPKPAEADTIPGNPGYYRPARYQHDGANSYQPSRTVPLQAGKDSSTQSQWVTETQEDYVKAKIENERLPPGFRQLMSRAYILRPEAIESVFYMYRITGEQHWRDAGWQMFQAVVNATRVAHGHSAIHDVTESQPFHTDQMESFWIAETLKYFYLLFDDPANWSLDEWVLNTEAHFFRRPENPRTA